MQLIEPTMIYCPLNLLILTNCNNCRVEFIFNKDTKYIGYFHHLTFTCLIFQKKHTYLFTFLHTDWCDTSSWNPSSCITHLHSQYHGCWWPGDARIQGISNHDIDLIKPWKLIPLTSRFVVSSVARIWQNKNKNYGTGGIELRNPILG